MLGGSASWYTACTLIGGCFGIEANSIDANVDTNSGVLHREDRDTDSVNKAFSFLFKGLGKPYNEIGELNLSHHLIYIL